MKKISIVIPCFNEQEAIPHFYREMLSVMSQMSGYSFELIFVDDGSIDDTMKMVKNLAENDECVKYIELSRNFGKESAMYAGIKASSGDYTAVMDADLQDPPSLLPEMVKIIEVENYDSVATRRVTRHGEPAIRSFFARLFYRLLKRISKTELVDGARDYRLMSRKFVDALLKLGEYNRFSKGLFGWIGFKTKWLEYENINRVAGETKWSFWKLLLYAFDGIIAFSTAPLAMAAFFGMLFCIISFIVIGFIIVRRLLFGDPVAGWASLMSAILLVGGVQLFCVGILGQYLAKTYLETKKRPIFICKETNIEMSEN